MTAAADSEPSPTSEETVKPGSTEYYEKEFGIPIQELFKKSLKFYRGNFTLHSRIFTRLQNYVVVSSIPRSSSVFRVAMFPRHSSGGASGVKKLWERWRRATWQRI